MTRHARGTRKPRQQEPLDDGLEGVLGKPQGHAPNETQLRAAKRAALRRLGDAHKQYVEGGGGPVVNWDELRKHVNIDSE